MTSVSTGRERREVSTAPTRGSENPTPASAGQEAAKTLKKKTRVHAATLANRTIFMLKALVLCAGSFGAFLRARFPSFPLLFARYRQY
jgi:hypothetical protein